MSGEYIQKTGCTIHERLYVDKHKIAWHRCTCHCGKEFEARGTFVRRGKRRSCGCLNSHEARVARYRKNKKSDSLSLQLWAMRLWVGAE